MEKFFTPEEKKRAAEAAARLFRCHQQTCTCTTCNGCHKCDDDCCIDCTPDYCSCESHVCGTNGDTATDEELKAELDTAWAEYQAAKTSRDKAWEKFKRDGVRPSKNQTAYLVYKWAEEVYGEALTAYARAAEACANSVRDRL